MVSERDKSINKSGSVSRKLVISSPLKNMKTKRRSGVEDSDEEVMPEKKRWCMEEKDSGGGGGEGGGKETFLVKGRKKGLENRKVGVFNERKEKEEDNEELSAEEKEKKCGVSGKRKDKEEGNDVTNGEDDMEEGSDELVKGEKKSGVPTKRKQKGKENEVTNSEEDDSTLVKESNKGFRIEKLGLVQKKLGVPIKNGDGKGERILEKDETDATLVQKLKKRSNFKKKEKVNEVTNGKMILVVI